MPNKFKIIVADPPWGGWNDKLKMSDVRRGADDNYSTMTIKQIKELPIKNIADDSGALLALWVPSSLLQEGLDVMKAWGFKHKQTYIWVKTKKEPLKKLLNFSINNISECLVDKIKNSIKSILTKEFLEFKLLETLAFGMGRLFRQTHEICLIGINNNGIYKDLKNKSQRSVSFDVNLRHSTKPEALQDSLDLMFPDFNDKKIEIFSRRQREGWVCIGKEAPLSLGKDILDSLNDLL